MQEPGDGSTTAASATSLVVTVWGDPATSAAPTTATFDKAPGLTMADLAPTTPDQACTEIYGGPGKATVTGTLDGAAVDATFTRSNGCEIARWEKMVALGLIPAGIGGM